MGFRTPPLPANWSWFVVVRPTVDDEAKGCRAIGPTSWTRARELAASWEGLFGEGTAMLTESLHPQTRRVAVW